MGAKRIALLILKVGISIGLIAFLLSGLDLAQIAARVRGADPLLAAAAVAVLLLQAVIGAGRWRVATEAVGRALSRLFLLRAFFVGMFFGQALPGAGGDAVRFYLAYRETGALGAAASGLMLERMAAICGLLAVVAITQLLFASRIGGEMAHNVGLATALLAGAALLGLAGLMVLDQVLDRLRRYRFVDWLASLGADTRRLFFRPRLAARAFAWGIATHLNLAFAVFVLARALDLEAGLIDCLVIVPPVILVTTLPVTIAGWGLRETAMVIGFGLVGVSGEGALALSILFGLLLIVASLPGAAIWLVSARARRGPEAAEPG